MKTADEIRKAQLFLESKFPGNILSFNTNCYHGSATKLLYAMQQYADGQAVGFVEWKDKNFYMVGRDIYFANNGTPVKYHGEKNLKELLTMYLAEGK